MRTKARSLALVTVAYVVAFAAAATWLIWGVHTGRLWLDTLVADVLATVVVFVFSRDTAIRVSTTPTGAWCRR